MVHRAVPALCLALLAAAPAARAQDSTDAARELVGRLDLARYKATLGGLAAFGDRRQGTDRNRAAIDWIEAQLKAYGCTDTERLIYSYEGRQVRESMRPAREWTNPNGTQPRYDRRGNRIKGNVGPTGVNMDPSRQPDSALRAINAQPDEPGERQEVWCTKIGTTHPDEMYIVGAHMDGHGYGAAVNDNGSGTALVMELARVLNAPGVESERSIRFVLWNNEETGLNGARAYVAQRKELQGIESPAGSGRYPEPRWLGMIQHDMMMWDHGMPRADGTLSPSQRPEADVNIEFSGSSAFADQAQAMAWLFRRANDRYATDYPAAVGDRMSNTDSDAFKDLVPAISLRENERLAQIGSGWDPNWHQPSDVMSTYTDDDFRLGLNAGQTTLAALVELAGVTVK